MISTHNIIILFVSILFFGYRAYKKGFWQTLVGLVGIVLTYMVCFFTGVPFVTFLQTLGFTPIIAYPIGLIGLFIIAAFVFTRVPVLFFPSFKHVAAHHRKYGAIVGVLLGIIVGLFMVWSLSTAKLLFELKTASNDASTLLSTKETTDILDAMASSLVVTTVRTSMKIINGDASIQQPVNAQKAASAQQLAVAFIKTPAEFIVAFQDIAKAPELKAFLNEQSVKLKMARNDTSGLVSEPAFESLIELAGVKTVLNYVVEQENIQALAAREFFAEKLSYIWRRMRYIRSDPRVVAILEDESFQVSLSSQNPLVLLSHKKAQALVNIVMEKDDMEHFDFVADVQNNPHVIEPYSKESDVREFNDATTKASEPPVKSAVVYRWKDKNGKTRYTTYEKIPQHRRDGAELFTQ